MEEKSMFAIDVMSAPVITVEETTPVAEIARLMSERRVTGVPVLDHAGKVVGMVTDGDLCRRAELGTERKPEGLLDLLFFSRPDAKDFVEARGRIAADVMTRDVYAVRPDTPLDRVADLFESRRIRRAPVLDDGRLVGVVSRADLVRAIVARAETPATANLSDRQVRDLVMAEFKRLNFGLRSEGSVIVRDGVVHLWGLVPDETERRALRIAVETLPGVKAVEDHTGRFFAPFGVDPKSPGKVTIVD
jgi:CBS domain-containing protein